MPKTSVIQARIDPVVKAEAQEVLDTLNISMSEAISMYLTQITLYRGIPFEMKIPNELTAQTLRNTEEGRDLHRVSSLDELFSELER